MADTAFSVRRFAAHAAGAALLVLLSLWARALVESRSAVQHARAALEAGDGAGAVASYREALRWTAPVNPWRVRAMKELERLAVAENVDDAQRLAVLRELLRGLAASRSVFSMLSGETEIAAAVEGEIDRLESARGNERRVFEARRPRIRAGMQIGAQLLFWAWVCAAGTSILFGMNAEGSVRKRSFAAGVAATAVLFVLWIAALRLA